MWCPLEKFGSISHNEDEMKEMNITIVQTLKEMMDPCRKWSSAAAHKPRRKTSDFVSLLVEVHATRSPLAVQRVGLCTSKEGGTVQSLVREILQATHHGQK